MGVFPGAPRRAKRLAPKKSATVAIRTEDASVVYGVVLNISDSGACIATAAPLPTGANVHLEISIYRQPMVFETEAHIVWSRDGARLAKNLRGLLLHGVQFDTSDEGAERLDTLLSSPELEVVFAPTPMDFNAFVEALSPDLERLVSLLEKSIRDQ